MKKYKSRMHKPKKKKIPKRIIDEYGRNLRIWDAAIDSMTLATIERALADQLKPLTDLRKRYPGIGKEYQKQIDKEKVIPKFTCSPGGAGGQWTGHGVVRQSSKETDLGELKHHQV